MAALSSGASVQAFKDSALTLDVSTAFGAQDQREKIAARFTDTDSRLFLQHAAQAELAAMQQQVQAGYNINTEGLDGVTPAMAYVSYIRPVRADVLAQLVKLGADLTQPMRNRMSLLNGLARLPDPALLTTLLGAGLSPDTELPAIKETWLTVAILENNTELVQGLLKAGANPSLLNQQGRSPWQAAVGLGNWIAADALIKAGANPRQHDPDLARLSRALTLRPPAASSAQGAAHGTVSRWLAAQQRS